MKAASSDKKRDLCRIQKNVGHRNPGLVGSAEFTKMSLCHLSWFDSRFPPVPLWLLHLRKGGHFVHVGTWAPRALFENYS
jgi:hypothetical protein